jgi:hypothetical protein
MVRRWISALVMALLLGSALFACEQRKQGPMEKAGEKIDEAVDKITHPDEGALEKAGRKTDEAIDAAKKKLE